MKQRHPDLVQNPLLGDSAKGIRTMNSTSGTAKRRTAPSGQTLIDWEEAGGLLRSNFMKLINTSLLDTYTTRERACSNCRGTSNY